MQCSSAPDMGKFGSEEHSYHKKKIRNIMNNRLLWRSRRGALELDLVLIPYTEKRYPYLSTQLRKDYERLLELEDIQLKQWLIEGQPANNPFPKDR